MNTKNYLYRFALAKKSVTITCIWQWLKGGQSRELKSFTAGGGVAGKKALGMLLPKVVSKGS